MEKFIPYHLEVVRGVSAEVPGECLGQPRVPRRVAADGEEEVPPVAAPRHRRRHAAPVQLRPALLHGLAVRRRGVGQHAVQVVYTLATNII